MDDKISKLRFYSIGIVAENKKLDSKEVEVVPIEDSPMLDGELNEEFEEYAGKGQSESGESFDVTIKTTSSVRATWLPLGETNRITAPDVRRGEHVILLRFADADEYFWITAQQRQKIRRLETVVYAYSNNREENVENSHDTSYWMEVSTHRKLIHLHTSKNDDEPFIYDIQLNTKEGFLIIQDDDDNSIFLDSKNRIIRMTNKDGSYIEIDKKNITVNAIETFFVKAKDMKVDLQNSYEINAGNSMKQSTKTYTSNTVSYTITQNDYQSTAQSWNVYAPTSTFHGNQYATGSSDNHHGHP